MPRKKPARKYAPPRLDSPQDWAARVRSHLPDAWTMIVYGWDDQHKGLHSQLESRLKSTGVWQKHNNKNEGGDPDAICDMFIDASDEAFTLGVAYGLQLNAATFLKDGVR